MNPILATLLLVLSLLKSCGHDDPKEAIEAAMKLKQEGKYQEALEAYNTVIKAHDDIVSAYINRGNVRSLLNDDQGAIEDYDRAEKLEPSEPEVFYNRGKSKTDLQL